MIATLERRWRDGEYGRKVVKEAEELFSNHPVSITECYLSPAKYMFRFKNFNRRKT